MAAKKKSRKRKARKASRKLVCPKRWKGRKVRAKGGICQVTLKNGKKKRVKKVRRRRKKK